MLFLLQGSSATLIPSGISDGCSSFLNKLNSDATLTDCTSSLISATSAYAPGGDGTTNPSPAKVGSALSNLCSTSVADKCPDSLVGGKIAEFQSACSVELTSKPNTDVLRTYDILYTLTPLKTAICSKDDGGNFCSTLAKIPSSSGTSAQVQKILSNPLSATDASLIPNTTTYHTTNLPFLFLQSSSADLCNVCTRKILNAYLSFEAKSPYAPGLGKSLLLSAQVDLYQGVQTSCGSNFLSDNSVVKAAGGLSGDSITSGASQTRTQGFLAAGLSVLAFTVSAVL